MVHCTRAALQLFIPRRSGVVINLSSVAATRGGPEISAYAATKAAIEGFTRCVAAEVGSLGVRVLAVAPSFVRTDMTATVLDEIENDICKKLPLRRLVTPEDVAKAVAFLASPSAAGITGCVQRVDGGVADIFFW